MTSLYPICTQVDLHVKGRISSEDADRQHKTACEILKRLSAQPGLILADEVGMGKTFVALAVAVSIALANRGKRPVVVMVPSALKEKWPADFSTFRERCLPPTLAQTLRCATAERTIEFLKMLDDPPQRRNALIFLTHGAMSRGLNDHWVMLALIRQSLYRRKNIDNLRVALCRFLGDLLQKNSIQSKDPKIWLKLLRRHPSEWLPVLRELDLEHDDPVPEAVCKVLPELNTQSVFEAIQQIPLRKSKNYDAYVLNARSAIKEAVRALWAECLAKTKIRLPLLILDEAHHLKNDETRLASLFRSADAHGDADEISRGPLAGVFERMLFLTATPFQLGHGELCSVLDRFDGICWKGNLAPGMGRDGFANRRASLRASLDAAQESAVSLDHAWGRLTHDDLRVNGTASALVDEWWPKVKDGAELTAAAADVLNCYRRTQERMAMAQEQIRPWVVRHLRPRQLSAQHIDIPRRQKFIGRSIELGSNGDGEQGIAVRDDALLPFLLAARAASQSPESRPVFAEGLASSYEAFLHTRQTRGANATDGDDDAATQIEVNDAAGWYLDHLESLIPRGASAKIRHPKVAATVNRVVDIWRRGEKALVFCHYVATGRALRHQISEAIRAEIYRLGAEKLGIPLEDVADRLDLIGKRFFDEDSPLRQACDHEASNLISHFSGLTPHRDDLIEIIRRNVRTPSFLVRYLPLGRDNLDAAAMQEALDSRALSDLTLRRIVQQFLSFLQERCGEKDRERYIDAVRRIQTGSHFGVIDNREYEDDELQGSQPEQLLPNVRLVNGTTRSDTRQRLMLTFNTPFYPEILIASSVMAEGVDLHLNCRYVLHHDLCWNPSTLEQRCGRVDRIGAKAELAGRPIHIYIPFVAETQDEKMYRVVMDRERWFNVVMGENYKVDARTTEKLANRIPFPGAAADALTFQLGVGPDTGSMNQPAADAANATVWEVSVPIDRDSPTSPGKGRGPDAR